MAAAPSDVDPEAVCRRHDGVVLQLLSSAMLHHGPSKEACDLLYALPS